MKKYILQISFLLVSVFNLQAQINKPVVDTSHRQERIKALYVAYLTQQLNLNVDEAQKFWPLHKQFETEIKQVNSTKLPELDRQQNVLNIKRKYQPNFTAILGTERCEHFFRIDSEFKHKLLKRIADQKTVKP